MKLLIPLLALLLIQPKPDTFQQDFEAIYGDSTGYMYQYRSAAIRRTGDTTTKLMALHNALVALNAKYDIQAELADERRQPWNQSCNIVCGAMHVSCTYGCHPMADPWCTKMCSNNWESCARFCNTHFPGWPD